MVPPLPLRLSPFPFGTGSPHIRLYGMGFEQWDSQRDATKVCCREDIFQAVTACTLGLAVPGESEWLHRCRRARAETIRTVYKAKAN